MTSQLRRELSGLARGDHLCLTHETLAELVATAATFLGDGIDRGERSLLVGAEDRAEEISMALAASGTDVAHAHERGALRTVSRLDIACLAPGEFNPHAMAAFLRRMEEEALADGFNGLRVAGDMSWAMGLRVPPDRLIEFEVLLEQSLSDSHSIVICQYDRALFDPAIIYEVLRAHPIAVLGGRVCPNPYYEPPELLLQRTPDGAEVKAERVNWWITQLKRARAAEQERERALEALGVSEERFRRAFAEAAIGMALMTPDGRFLQVNAAYVAMTGYSEAEIVGTRFDAVTHGDDLPAYARQVQRMVEGEIPSFVTEKRYLEKAGEVAWHRESVSLLRDRRGAPLNIIALVEDITARKIAEEELSRYAQQLRGLADASLTINSRRSPPRVAEAVTEAARQIIGAHQAVAALTVDANGSQAIQWVSLSEKYAAWRDYNEQPVRSGIYTLICETNRPIRLTQAELEAHPRWRAFGKEAGTHPPMRGWLAAPLVGSDGRNLGLIQLSDRYEGDFTAADEAVLVQLAQMASIAIENAWLYERLRAGHMRLQDLTRRLLEVQEAERRHLARELHDEFGQLLTGLRLLLKSRADRAADRGETANEQARALVDELLNSVRGLSFDLRPAALDQLGLLPALLTLFERYTERTGVAVDFKHDGLDRRFEPEAESAAYRIVQEALTNVARHAGVSAVTVRAWSTAATLGLQVQDAGRGFDPKTLPALPPAGGLLGMRERVLLLGGHLSIDSSPGAGTQIVAEIPLTSRTGGTSDDDLDRTGR